MLSRTNTSNVGPNCNAKHLRIPETGNEGSLKQSQSLTENRTRNRNRCEFPLPFLVPASADFPTLTEWALTCNRWVVRRVWFLKSLGLLYTPYRLFSRESGIQLGTPPDLPAVCIAFFILHISTVFTHILHTDSTKRSKCSSQDTARCLWPYQALTKKYNTQLSMASWD